MHGVFYLRLGFDLIAACLLLFGLSYWWLGNGIHEAAGTVMFVLVIAHNVFNRRFYGNVTRTRREARGLVNIGVTVALLAAMTMLLVTSLLISNILSPLTSSLGSFTARQIHLFAAYWALVIVAIHLGMRWPMLMGVARTACGITRPSARRAWALRLIAVAVVAQGIRSSFILGLGTRLGMQVTLDWWNFDESVIGFFVHCVAVAGLYIALTYYAMRLLRPKRVGMA